MRGVRNRIRSTPAIVATVAVIVAVLSATMVTSSSATIRPDERSSDHVRNVAHRAAAAPADWVAVDEATEAGFGVPSTKSWSASTVDYNLDGAQDVLIGYHLHGAKLWMNLGDGHYSRQAASAWPTRFPGERVTDRHNCAWADVDLNGLPDAYCSAGRTLENRVKRGMENELWLQGPAGEFREVGKAWGVTDICGRGRSVAFLDANGDRFPDLFLGNEVPRRVRDRCDHSAQLPNEESKLFINDHGQRFRYAPKLWRGEAGIGVRCVEVLDINRDGRDDLFACRGEDQSPVLYVHRPGRGFVNETSRHGLRSRINDATLADVNGDNRMDLVTAGPRAFGYHLFANGRFGPLRVIGTVPTGIGWAVAAGDADGDGDADVYGMIGEENPRDFIWLNNHLRFSPIPVPTASGNADDVVTLRPSSGTPHVAFLALNGRKSPHPGGPVQLIHLVHP